MESKNKKFLILLAVVILIGVAYFYFKKPSSPTSNSSLSSSNGESVIPTSAGDKVTSDISFLSTLVALKKINIDTTLFASSSFNALKNSNIKIGTVTPGRPNPFAPIGGFKYRLVKKKIPSGTGTMPTSPIPTIPTDQTDPNMIPPVDEVYVPVEDPSNLEGAFPYQEYFDEEYDIIQEPIDEQVNTVEQTANSVDVVSLVDGAVLTSHNIQLDFVATGTPISCWYDLGGKILDYNTQNNIPSTPGDPVDMEYQYPLENCNNKVIVLPDGEYVINVWAKYSSGEYDFESNFFRVKATP